VHLRTSIKNRVHALLARQGILPEHCDLFGTAGREYLAALELPDGPRRRLDSLISLISDLAREIIQIVSMSGLAVFGWSDPHSDRRESIRWGREDAGAWPSLGGLTRTLIDSWCHALDLSTTRGRPAHGCGHDRQRDLMRA
jgi:hypothetical protein